MKSKTFWMKCPLSDSSFHSSRLVSPVPQSPPGGVQCVWGVCHDVARSPGRSFRPAGRCDGGHDRLPQGRWGSDRHSKGYALTEFLSLSLWFGLASTSGPHFWQFPNVQLVENIQTQSLPLWAWKFTSLFICTAWDMWPDCLDANSFVHILRYRCRHHHHLLHTSAAQLVEGVRKEGEVRGRNGPTDRLLQKYKTDSC